MNVKDRQLQNLMLDCATGRVGLFANEQQVPKTSEAIRLRFFDILGEDKLTWRGWRNHHNEIFTVIEDVLNTTLPLSWENITFFQQFAETRNLALGDKNEFVVEDNSVLVANTFSGNHWDTDRKKLPGRKKFSLDTEWIYVHIYDDFERFLKGIVDFPTFISKMQDAMNRAINERIFAGFNAAGTYLPAQFSKSGTYNRLTMAELIQRVQTATQRNVVIAGTKTALSYVAEGMNTNWISNSQKEEMAATGMVLQFTGLGVMGVEIPQTFIRGTYDFLIDNQRLLVLPDNEKFIKVVFEGDTRARDLNETDTHDQTIDTQIQTKVGVGCVFSTVFGKYDVEP